MAASPNSSRLLPPVEADEGWSSESDDDGSHSTICFIKAANTNSHSVGAHQEAVVFERTNKNNNDDEQQTRSNIHTGRSSIKENPGEPSVAVKDKLASKQAPGTRPAGQTTATGGSGAGNQSSLGQNDHEHDDQDQDSKQTNRRSLLEALIGDRARSWRDQRTVIVDIQNGRSKSASKSREELQRYENSTQSIEPPPDHQQEQQPLAGAATTVENTRRLPTFGSIPQRLSAARLPYLSYSGRSKNVELASAANRIVVDHADQVNSPPVGPASRYVRLTRSDGSAASLSSSSTRASNHSGHLGGTNGSSSSSSGSAHSSQNLANTRIPTLARTSKFALIDNSQPEPKPHEPTITESQENNSKLSNLFGFSNISNLFPKSRANNQNKANQNNNPTSPTSSSSSSASSSASSSSSSSLLIIQRSNSLVNLSKQQQTNNRLQQLADKKLLASLSTSGRNSSSLEAQQRRQQQQLRHRNRSVSSLNELATGATWKGPRYLQPTQATIMRRQQQMQEQQANNGVGPAGPHSPNYGNVGSRQGGYGGDKRRGRPASAAGNYLAGHQRSPSAGSLLAGRHSGSAGMSPYGAGSYAGAHHRSSSLLDADCPVHSPQEGQAAPYRPGNRLQQQQQQQPGHLSQADLLYEPENQKGSAIYSPVSPQTGRFNGRAGGSSGNLPAYYNSASKFSSYYNSPTEGIRSGLATPNEQVRRILGYHRPVHTKPIHLHPQWAYSRPFIHLQSSSPYGNLGMMNDDDNDLLDDIDGPRFVPFNQLQDTQAIRAIDFHPSGEVYAVGSNSRALRICAYPAEHELRHFNPLGATAGNTQPVKAPRVLFKFLQVHRGSIYCVSFNQTGQLLATGSNDQTVHIVRYNSVTHNPDGDEFRLTMHNGTIRDLCFIDDHTSGSSLLLSAGGGDNKIYVTDCDTITPFQSMAGHTQMVMALHHCGGAQFVSGSYDKTIRFWDLRSRACTSIISAPAWSGATTLGGPGAPVCSLRADQSGRLLATGHTDATCMLYDIRAGKIIQTFRPHDDEIRAISFSAKSYYLLTGAYDGRLVVSDLQGDLSQPLPSVCVAESRDKIVQAKWHPNDFTFVSTSADKTATLWALPGDF